MRVTEFWHRMHRAFGPAYADSVAMDQALRGLDGRTAAVALANGVEPRAIWLAVCEAYEIPEARR